MRALIAGIVFVGGAVSACTPCSSCGTARYSGDSAPAPLVARRNVPVWPTQTATSVAQAPTAPAATYAPSPTPVPSYVPPRTAASQPIVLSSRSAPAPSPTLVSSRATGALPPPASRARTAAEFAAALRPINATCPVMLGTPVDPSVTASYLGRVVAFSDTRSRSAWLGDPERYSRNLPGSAAFGSASDSPVFAAASAPAPRPAYAPSASTYAPTPPAAIARPVYAEPAPAPAPTPAPVYATAAPPALPAPAAAPAPRALPVPVATRPATPAPAPAAATEEDDAGGVCVDGECKGGNCALPARRK